MGGANRSGALLPCSEGVGPEPSYNELHLSHLRRRDELVFAVVRSRRQEMVQGAQD